MNLDLWTALIAVAGIGGLGVAAYFYVRLAIDAVRRREPLDILLASAVAVATVWLLFAYGDSLLQ